jgi:hypothetical protein
MSTLSQFAGGLRATRQVINQYAVAGFAGTFVEVTGARSLLSGALTANTLKSILTVTGAGQISGLGIAVENATSRTIRLRLVVDGVAAFDFTSAAIATTSNGCLIGSGRNSVSGEPVAAPPIVFLQSLDVQIASSLSESDSITTQYILHGV